MARIREALVTACTCGSRARSTAADGETPRRYIRESKGVKIVPGIPSIISSCCRASSRLGVGRSLWGVHCTLGFVVHRILLPLCSALSPLLTTQLSALDSARCWSGQLAGPSSTSSAAANSRACPWKRSSSRSRCGFSPRQSGSDLPSWVPLTPCSRQWHCLRRDEGASAPPRSTANGSAALTGICAEQDPVNDAEQYGREIRSLNVAIVANLLIFMAKVWVHSLTGSSSLLAEALHSVADILNQVLLRVGVTQSTQGPTTQFPYGFARDRFVWSLISAVGVFFLGAGASVLHGIQSLTSTHQMEGAFFTFVVLGVSGLLEGFSLFVAVRSIMESARARNMGFLTYVKSGVDPTTVAVLMEDGGALLGLAIAAICTALSHVTGNIVWDAAGSICIGLLLGAIACFLVSKNRQLLIGRSMNPREVEEVMSLLRRDPVVSYVLEAKTEEIGPRIFRFKAEVAWDGEKLSGRYLERVTKTGGRQHLEKKLRAALESSDPAELDAVLKAYGRDIISAVGAEVDRIETEIQCLNPGIRYVDLETDRGRFKACALMSSSDVDFDPGPVSVLYGTRASTRRTPVPVESPGEPCAPDWQ